MAIEEWVDDYFKNIDELSNGERAALKRACGKLPGEADTRAFSAYIKALPSELRFGGNGDKKREMRWFMVGCLRCMWRPEEAMTITIEDAITDCGGKDENEGFLKRLNALNDTSNRYQDDLFVKRFWRFVKLLKSRGYVIDFKNLLTEELEKWDYSGKPIQRKWIRAYFKNK